MDPPRRVCYRAGRMRNRVVSILLLLWLVPLFTIVAAGHSRGAIRLPGSDAGPAAGAPACSLCNLVLGGGRNPDPADPTTPAPADDGPATPGKNSPVPIDPSGSCAICNITRTIVAPAPIDLAPAPLYRLPWPAPQTDATPFVSILLPRELAGRAPPTAA